MLHVLMKYLVTINDCTKVWDKSCNICCNIYIAIINCNKCCNIYCNNFVTAACCNKVFEKKCDKYCNMQLQQFCYNKSCNNCCNIWLQYMVTTFVAFFITNFVATCGCIYFVTTKFAIKVATYVAILILQ